MYFRKLVNKRMQPTMIKIYGILIPNVVTTNTKDSKIVDMMFRIQIIYKKGFDNYLPLRFLN